MLVKRIRTVTTLRRLPSARFINRWNFPSVKWQKNLKLLDWGITAKVVDDTEYEILEVSAGVNKGESSGFNYVTADRCQSDIFIKKSCPDYELYLIHELVHILLNPLDDISVSMLNCIPNVTGDKLLSTQRTDALEKTNWNVTRALYNLNKGE